MTINELIESGNLEAYLLGNLSKSEADEIERMAEQFPEIKEELAAIEVSMEFMAKKLAVRPRDT